MTSLEIRKYYNDLNRSLYGPTKRMSNYLKFRKPIKYRRFRSRLERYSELNKKLKEINE